MVWTWLAGETQEPREKPARSEMMVESAGGDAPVRDQGLILQSGETS